MTLCHKFWRSTTPSVFCKAVADRSFAFERNLGLYPRMLLAVNQQAVDTFHKSEDKTFPTNLCNTDFDKDP
jgi:hypothetical protein